MKEINLKNYEAYFLDFVEGNLSEPQAEMLRDILKANPHLNTELDSYEQIAINDKSAIGNRVKNQLLREETTGMPLVDYLMIAQVEEKITPTEKGRLANIVAEDQSILSDLVLYHKVKLPKENIAFPNKNALKRGDRKGMFWIKFTSTAAAAAILALVLVNLNPIEKQYEPERFTYKTEQINDEVKEPITSSIVIRETIGQESLNKNISSIVQSQSTKITQTKEVEKIPNIRPLAYRSMATAIAKQEKLIKNVDRVEPQNALAINESLADNNTVSQAAKNKFISLPELAAQKLKSDVLNNKTLKEALLEELAELSNGSLSIEKPIAGKAQKFAINIGKFSYSNF